MNEMHDWILPSNSGREAASGVLNAVRRELPSDLLVFAVQFTATSFNRYDLGGPTPDYEILFHSIAISREKLSKAIASLDAWLNCPRAFKISLSAIDGETLDFVFGTHPEIISTLEKPFCSIMYRARRASCEIGFVVDNSCIQVFRETLSVFLKQQP